MGDVHVRRTGDDYTQGFLSLLPYGQAWPRAVDGTLFMTVRGLCNYWGYVDGDAADLLEIESDPRKTVQLLPDWERNWGLPDPCYTSPQTISARQIALVQRMTLQGNSSRAFYINFAKTIGYTITITEYRPFMVGLDRVGDNRVIGDGTTIFRDEFGHVIPDPLGNVPIPDGQLSEYPYTLGPPENRYYWTVHVANAPLQWFRCSSGQCGVDPHLRIGIPQDLECVLARWKPAHTEIVYDFANLEAGGPMDGTP